MPPLASVAAVVVDCREAASLAAFYQPVFGGEIIVLRDPAGHLCCICARRQLASIPGDCLSCMPLVFVQEHDLS
jgi:hypothetical protein